MDNVQKYSSHNSSRNHYVMVFFRTMDSADSSGSLHMNKNIRNIVRNLELSIDTGWNNDDK